MVFKLDGTYRTNPGNLDAYAADLGKDYVTALKVMAAVPGRYSRGEKVIVLTTNWKAVREATAAAKVPTIVGANEPKTETVDIVVPYSLGGDVLEMTFKDKVVRYVRVR
jgi:hypothetical protein